MKGAGLRAVAPLRRYLRWGRICTVDADVRARDLIL